MLIPGWLFVVLMFPGAIVHETAHRFFRRLAGVRVAELTYFQHGGSRGASTRDRPRGGARFIAIGIGPFIVNSLLAVMISLPATVPALHFASAAPLDYVLIWLGVSVGMYSFPALSDARAIRRALAEPEVPRWARAIGVPVANLLYLCAVGSLGWLDLVYGTLVALVVPGLLVRVLA